MPDAAAGGLPRHRRLGRAAGRGRDRRRGSRARAARHVGPHDPINIQYTSGTTGHPKGATLSHRNILNNGFADAVRAYAAGRLAPYKIPRYVMVVEDFPMTVTGKVRKVEMRERSATELGLG